MNEYILDLLYHTIYVIELFLVGEWTYHNRVKGFTRYVLLSVTYLIAMILGKDMMLWVSTVFEVAVYIFLFQGKLRQKIVNFGEIYLVTGIIEVMVGGLLSLIPNKIFRYNTVTGELIAALVSAVLVYGAVKCKWLQNFFQYLRRLKWYQYMAIVIVVCSGIFLLVISEFTLALIDNQRISILFHTISTILYCAMIAGIIAFVYGVYKTEYYSQQNELKDEIIYAQQQNYQNLYENDKEMRAFRHEINKQIGFLNILLRDGKTEQALSHLKSMEDDYNSRVLHKFNTGNEILDVVINYTYSYAKEKNVKLDVKGRICEIKHIDVYDLCTIFSNAINNGVEAYDNMQNCEKTITVSLLEQEHMVSFRFENFATREMYLTIKQKSTTKKDKKNHGFGVENIRRAVYKNHGEMEYRYENGKIILEIYFAV